MIVPAALVDIEERGARGVGGIGGVNLATGQAPDEERVDRAEAKLATFGALARSLHMIKQPIQLGGGEIGIEQQAGAGGDFRFMAGIAKRRTGGGRPPVLPDA